jgi:hypothetical protein
MIKIYCVLMKDEDLLYVDERKMKIYCMLMKER